MARRLAALAAFASFASVSLQQSCGAAWVQCGGQGWSGATCCVGGYTCQVLNPYYSQCLPASQSSSAQGGTTSTASSPAGSSSTLATSITATYSGPSTYTTTDTATVAAHTQLPYPSADPSSCGAWTMVDGVCCPTYCSTDNKSESCSSSCTGACTQPPSADCKSGTMWGEQHHVTENETWWYSRSTHFGLTSGGACGFGLYGLCTKGSSTASWTDPMLGSTCDAFCTAYPTLCKDPSGTTLRGNFAAPNGDYYTQFWSSLVGDRDNYLSCGECFELIRTKSDGTDYAVGEAGYTDPIILEIVDSCPCSANSKWCCGSGADHCGEIDFKYGCPIPEGAHHMDLSDIAMGRLQGNGSLTDGVIPIRYKRAPCPKPGNIYIWLREGGGAYYFSLSAVNANGPGSVTKVEIKGGAGAGAEDWTPMVRDPNYTSSRPQERYGAWVVPTGAGPFSLPIAVRLTSPTGQQVVNTQAINSFTPPASAPAGFYYLDLGVQFSDE
ncbi:Expansin module family protein [Pleurostoma richardsiae]|uniref:Expansin module family protein n=1 Tax=Pleurostoma richardsiae TaxID=41990 RepID=A0AA38VJM1_9PEZI|nr:Expansin module family protein [Pleurostoma richardsiae]